ncbi:MAG: LLM class flavin-dependent oxidoreductase [Anaerolineaceae bacterium]|nr:LLM class flavin-dependent oxidoreductase [Anaerolineaceae bacterium]
MIKLGTALNYTPNMSVGKIVELAQEAERLGFSRCWIADEGIVTRDCYVTLGAIAQKTSSILLGTGITNPLSRHPAVTAGAIASLDDISGGRAFLGIGAGGSVTFNSLALKHEKPLTAVRETLLATRALFHGEVVTFNGEAVKLHEAHLAYARPDIEIWLAGRGKKMLSLGGELADGVLLSFMHRALIPEYIDIIKSAAAAKDKKPKICYASYIIPNDKIFNEMRGQLLFRILDSPPQVKELIGFTPKDEKMIRQAIDANDSKQASSLLKVDWVRPFVIIGSSEECAAQMADLMNTFQVDEYMLSIYNPETAPELMEHTAKTLKTLQKNMP